MRVIHHHFTPLSYDVEIRLRPENYQRLLVVLISCFKKKNMKNKLSHAVRGTLTALSAFGLSALVSAQVYTTTDATTTGAPGVPATALGGMAMTNLTLLVVASVCMIVGAVLFVKEKMAKGY